MDQQPTSRNILLIIAGIAAIAILGMAILSAVLLLRPAGQTTQVNQETISAIAAKTMAVVQTEQALNAPPTSVSASPTIIPSQLPAENAQGFTATPTSQIVPTNTPLSIYSPTPSPTPRLLPTTAIPATLRVPTISPGGSGSSGGSDSSGPSEATRCNWAEMVDDITIPEGTVIGPGTRFTKIWKVKNIGTCSWTRDYNVVFADGKRMEGATFRIPSKIKPGESFNISIDMLSPDNEGTYTGEWLFKTPEGTRFGTGSSAKEPLVVEIEVDDRASGIVYDFIINYCAAEWENKSDELDCPGDEGDEEGFVVRVDDPALENRIENEPALWTQPEAIEDGLIQGTFPAYTVNAGDHFQATVGCLAGYERCQVMFQLKYQIGDGEVQTLGSWDESYDDETTDIDLDLSSLADQKVKFILIVKADGPSREDAAFWLVPQISR